MSVLDNGESVASLQAVVAGLEKSIASADALSAELAAREAQTALLESELANTSGELARTRSQVGELQSDTDVVLNQLGLLREERLDLQDQIDDLERRIESKGIAASAAQRAREAVTDTESASGFADRCARARSRLAIEAPGIGVDVGRATPVLFDT